MPADPLQPQPQPHPEVASQLHVLGVASDMLREAGLAGQEVADRCTENDVQTRSGYDRWATMLRYLGDVYVPQGWTRDRPGGFERLLSPNGLSAIVVAPGSYSTGVADRMPTTRDDRGPMTGEAVGHNIGQLGFPSNVHPMFAEMSTPDTRTWTLLHFFDKAAEELRLELSVAVEFSKMKNGRGIVTRFDPRLILPAVDLSGRTESRDDEDEGDDQIDIAVTRR